LSSFTNKVKDAKINENLQNAFSNVKINDNLKNQFAEFSESAQKGLKTGVSSITTDITNDMKQIKQIFTQVEDDTGMIADTEKFIELERLMQDCKITQHWKALHIQSKTAQWESIVGVSDSDNRFFLFNLALRSTIKVARIFDTRSLVTLIKITSRKNNPEILTFKFGNPEKFNALDKITADALKSSSFEFDCVLKLYMPGSAGDAARDIKMRIVNAIEKAQYQEDRAELQEKQAKGGVFKLDDSDSEEEDDVKVECEVKEDVKVEDIWTFEEKTDGNKPDGNETDENKKDENKKVKTTENDSVNDSKTGPESTPETKPENKPENDDETQNSQNTKNNDSSDDEDGPFAI